jgi:hypothetical protein
VEHDWEKMAKNNIKQAKDNLIADFLKKKNSTTR